MNDPGHDYARGLPLGLTAYFIWGSFPLVISMLGFASPYEIVVWRVVFGFLTAALLIAVTKNFKSLRETFKNRANVTWIAASAIFIFINWLVYVIAISEHHVVESSLGYFINPLVTILLAVVFLREKLSPVQWVAMSFGALAVIVLTIDYGRPPWIALILAGSFGIYGLAKNKLGGKVSALNSFAIESGFVVPIAIVQLFLIQSIGGGILFASQGVLGMAGLAMYGALTAIPLILFGAAAQHLPLKVMGFMQYIAPIIQFTLGLVVFQEPMPTARWLGFGLVWFSLAILSFDMIRSRNQRQS
ncbi:MAG: EamA family transporter RarD [Rhodoluna sp.]|nr:EamA family transporter RarD [Rhodoluna sp.]